MKTKNMAPLDVLASNEAPPENTHEISPSQENNNTYFENDNPFDTLELRIEGSETREYSHDLLSAGTAWLAAEASMGIGPRDSAFDRVVARAIEGSAKLWDTIKYKHASSKNFEVFTGDTPFYNFEGVPSDLIGRAWRLRSPETCWVKRCENSVYVLVYLLKNSPNGETVIGVDAQCPFLCRSHYLEDRDKLRDEKLYTNVTGWAIDVKYRNLLPLRHAPKAPKGKLSKPAESYMVAKPPPDGAKPCPSRQGKSLVSR